MTTQSSRALLLQFRLCLKNCSESEIPCNGAVIIKNLVLKRRHPHNTPLLSLTALDRYGRVASGKRLYQFAQGNDNGAFAVHEDDDGNASVVLVGDLEPGSLRLQVIVYAFLEDGNVDTVTIHLSLVFVSQFSF